MKDDLDFIVIRLWNMSMQILERYGVNMLAKIKIKKYVITLKNQACNYI